MWAEHNAKSPAQPVCGQVDVNRSAVSGKWCMCRNATTTTTTTTTTANATANDDAGAENSAGVESPSAVSAGRRPRSHL